MKLEELTALYSPLDIEYSQAMSGPYENLSFRTEDVTIIAGLKDGRISGFWRPVVAVGDDKLQKLHIERLYDICRNIYYMDFLIDGKLSVISQFLLRHGYKARPYYTQIIDLRKSEEELHTALRKSYKSLINNRMQYIKYAKSISDMCGMRKIINKDNFRSMKTWNIQQKMMDTGEAFLTIDLMPTNETTKLYAAAFFNWSSCGVVYYHSAVSIKKHPTQALLWKTILDTKQRGGKSFEMGEQVFNGNIKLMNISKFKRGFGGETKTRLILEKEK